MTQVYERERELQRQVAGTLAARVPEVEVLAVELGGPDRVCVYIDHPTGVDLALCERVTSFLDGFRSDYALDVSSPGLERPLRTREHFTRAVGRQVAVRTEADVVGRRRFRGEVVAAGEDAVTLALDGERLDVPYAAIVRGNLIDEGR